MAFLLRPEPPTRFPRIKALVERVPPAIIRERRAGHFAANVGQHELRWSTSPNQIAILDDQLQVCYIGTPKAEEAPSLRPSTLKEIEQAVELAIVAQAHAAYAVGAGA
jgi:hypothetical protein